MRSLLVAVLMLSGVLAAQDVTAQRGTSRSHAIYMTAVEFKGSTTTDQLVAPPIDPAKMSHGYAYKGPGQADPSAPQRWEVASYQFSPAFVTVQQGDSIMLRVFVANGDHHEIRLADPDGERIFDNATWDRGREHMVFVQAQKLGAYRLDCRTHAPS